MHWQGQDCFVVIMSPIDFSQQNISDNSMVCFAGYNLHCMNEVKQIMNQSKRNQNCLLYLGLPKGIDEKRFYYVLKLRLSYLL